MTYSVYTDQEGYIGEVSAPSMAAAVDFLTTQGYEAGTYELRELYN